MQQHRLNFKNILSETIYRYGIYDEYTFSHTDNKICSPLFFLIINRGVNLNNCLLFEFACFFAFV